MKATKAGQIVGKALESWSGEGGATCTELAEAQKTALSSGSLTDERSSERAPDLSKSRIAESNVHVNSPTGGVDPRGVAPLPSDPTDPMPHWSGPTPTPVCGKVLVFVNVSWYDPDVYLTDTGDLKLENSQFSSNNLQSSSNDSMINKNWKLKIKDEVVTRIGAFAEIAVANIQAGIIKTTELVADITTTNELRATNKIISPIVEVDHLKANTAEIAEATVSGTLVVDTIKANRLEVGVIDRLKERLDALASDVAQTQANQEIYSQTEKLLTQSATESADLAASTTSGVSLGSPEVKTDLNLTNDFNVMGNVNVFGVTRLADTYVSGSLTITNSSNESNGTNLTNLTLSGNTISVFGGALQILASEGVDIMNGSLVVDAQGVVRVKGDLYVGGTLHANSVNIENSKLKIENSAGDEVAAVDASGSATISKLVIASAPQDTSGVSLGSPEVKSNATAGKSILPAGETLITIHSSQVTDNTLVYITPISATGNQVLYVSAKESCSSGFQSAPTPCSPSFTVSVDKAIQADVEFNWWIIELKE